MPADEFATIREALGKARGGCNSMRWLHNNRHNFECAGESALGFFDAAAKDASAGSEAVSEALDALDSLEEKVRELEAEIRVLR